MKRLIFRLSSLGDLILAQSALVPEYSGETHWVVAREFEAIVSGNPKVQRVWSFDRRKDGSMEAWLKLLRTLHAEKYDVVLDLHSTLRTTIARFYFLWLSLKGAAPLASWRALSKTRLRRGGYFVFKELWPKFLRPTHLSKASAKLAGGTGAERADLRWLAAKASTSTLSPDGHPLIAVAPSSAWREKEWPTMKYFELIGRLRSQEPKARFVLFGTGVDPSAMKLRTILRDQGIPFEDRVGKLTLPEVASALGQCDFIVGPDTGLIHLAESVGTRALVLFGPTRSDFGFGPLRPESRSIHGPVRCSPCSKDGTLCYRFGDRYACLRKMKVDTVLKGVQEMIAGIEKPQRSNGPRDAGSRDRSPGR